MEANGRKHGSWTDERSLRAQRYAWMCSAWNQKFCSNPCNFHQCGCLQNFLFSSLRDFSSSQWCMDEKRDNSTMLVISANLSLKRHEINLKAREDAILGQNMYVRWTERDRGCWHNPEVSAPGKGNMHVCPKRRSGSLYLQLLDSLKSSRDYNWLQIFSSTHLIRRAAKPVNLQ